MVVTADDIARLDVASLAAYQAERLWDHIKPLHQCFDDFSRGRADMFALRLASPSTVAFEYKDKALITVEGIIPKLSGVIHFFTWDPKLTESEMTNVGREIVHQVMDAFALHRISAVLPATNKLAIRLATRTGFRYEGTLRQAFLIDARYIDCLVYGLLRSDFFHGNGRA